jgi:hypothetical protein
MAGRVRNSRNSHTAHRWVYSVLSARQSRLIDLSFWIFKLVRLT